MAWTVHTDLARPVAPVYASTAGSRGANSKAFLAAPSPAPPPPAAPAPAAAPPMAYSAPAQGIRRGTFIPPVGGYVNQLFGPTDVTFEPPFTYQGVRYPHFHTGIDIDAPMGTPIAAAAAGVVIGVGVSDGSATGYGNYVMIEHPQGYVTLYGHMEQVVVTPGQSVQQLQLIGYVGSTGMSTGPHLHFEIRRFGEFLDPLPYLLGRIRAGW